MDEKTGYQPVEPTTPVPYPYGIVQIAPPPPRESFPQKKRRITWRHVFLFYTLIALIIIGGVVVYFALPSLQGKHSTPLPKVTPTLAAIIPTATPTPIPSPTSQPTVNPNYTATDIMDDFVSAGIQPGDIRYGSTIWNWTEDTYFVSVHATSSVEWTDVTVCGSNCSPDNLGLWVYVNNTTAQIAYTDVARDETTTSTSMKGTPIENVQGRCLFLGSGINSIYGQVMDQHCI